MGYVYLSDLAQDMTADQATAKTLEIQAQMARDQAAFNQQQIEIGRQQAEATKVAGTQNLITGIVGGIIGSGATIGGQFLQQKAEEKAAKTRAKTDLQIEALRQQSAERQLQMQLQAQLAAARIPPAPGVDWKPVVLLGGGALVAATLIYVLLKD